MAKVFTSTANIGGDYTGTVTVSGAVLLGENISSGGANIPVIVTGKGTSASSIAPYSFVGGQLAKSNSSLSFVWNGSDYQDGDSSKPSYSDSNPYLGANRIGTFSINPNGNLDGTYIGTKSLKTHMMELSGFVMDTVSNPLIASPNLVHRDGSETITGAKTINASLRIGDGSNENVIIQNSSIRIKSYAAAGGGGGIFFYYGNVLNPTSSIKETQSGTLTFGSKLSVTGNTTFGSTSNTFSGITLSDGKTANLIKGSVYVATQSANNNSSLAASTEYVDTAISNIQGGAIFGSNGNYTGQNTFANTISLASCKHGTTSTKVNADFVKGNLYVADQLGTSASSLAANTKFVKNIVASLSASLRGNKNAIGSSIVPIYLTGTSSLNASLVQSNANVGNSVVPIYMSGGSLKAMTSSIGDVNSPVYLNGGSLTKCNSLVNVAAAQDVSGVKSFTTPAWFASSPRVYANAEKGNANSYNKYAFVDFCLSSLHSNFNSSSMRIGLVGSFVQSSGAYTQSYLAAYANKMSDGTNVTMGIRIAPDGKEKYMFGINPTDANSSLYNITSTTSSLIPTIGWANTYYARKDGATFTGGVNFDSTVNFKSSFELYGATPYIDFHFGNSTENNTARIIEDAAGQLRIMPCASSLGGSAADSAASIRLGTQTIGSGSKPVYVNGGRLTAFTASIGGTAKPVWVNGGTITAFSSSIGGTAKPVWVNGGTITAFSNTIGGTAKPVWVNGGTITAFSNTIGGTARPVYMNAGTMTACSSTVGNANQPVYMNGGTMTACNTMVSTIGNQNIGGTKNFGDYAVFNAGALFAGNSSLASTTQLVRNLNSTSWYLGRDGAMIRNGFSSGENQYSPVISTKAYAGSWEIGAYDSLSRLHLTYISDERYNSKVNGNDGQIIFETGRYRTVTSMPIGFCSVSGPITGADGYLKFDNIPCSGGTPTHVKITVINWGKTKYKASIGSSVATVAAHSNVTYTYDYAASSGVKVYLANASLSANFIVY